MTTDHTPVLVGRSTGTPAAAQIERAQTGLDLELRRARAIADAGEMLPPQYRGKPGAVVLIDAWARQRDIDTLTAMQNVSFVQGRPVVDATMQRAMAERAGYALRVEPGDEGATVTVFKGAERLGAETFTVEDARRAGLLTKDSWKKYLRNMLVARATTNALRFFAPDVLLGVSDPDEIDDPISTLTPSPTQAPEAAPEVVDAEVIDTPTPSEPEPEPSAWISVDQLKRDLRAADRTQADAISYATTIAADLGVERPSSIAQVAAVTSQPFAEAMRSWMAPAPESGYAPGEEPF